MLAFEGQGSQKIEFISFSDQNSNKVATVERVLFLLIQKLSENLARKMN